MAAVKKLCGVPGVVLDRLWKGFHEEQSCGRETLTKSLGWVATTKEQKLKRMLSKSWSKS